jgi:hypothetical protein
MPWLLMPNFKVLRAGGARKRSWVPLEWVYGKILGGGGRISAILFVLKWGVELILVFGMTGGVGIVP